MSSWPVVLGIGTTTEFARTLRAEPTLEMRAYYTHADIDAYDERVALSERELREHWDKVMVDATRIARGQQRFDDSDDDTEPRRKLMQRALVVRARRALIRGAQRRYYQFMVVSVSPRASDLRNRSAMLLYRRARAATTAFSSSSSSSLVYDNNDDSLYTFPWPLDTRITFFEPYTSVPVMSADVVYHNDAAPSHPQRPAAVGELILANVEWFRDTTTSIGGPHTLSRNTYLQVCV